MNFSAECTCNAFTGTDAFSPENPINELYNLGPQCCGDLKGLSIPFPFSLSFSFIIPGERGDGGACGAGACGGGGVIFADTYLLESAAAH